MNNKCKRTLSVLILAVLLAVLMALPASAALEATGPTTPLIEAVDDGVPGGPSVREPNISLNVNGEGADTVKVIMMLTILTVLPSILLMMTSFTRIIIVFSLLRNAMGLQQTPPNQVLIGLALFLSLFIMNPVITDINENAYKPYSDGVIDSTQFLDRAKVPVREFMLKQTKVEDVNLFLNLAGKEKPQSIEGYTMEIVIPAFLTSEIKRAFTIGFLIFIPFLIIDMVVASALMSMGMMMLPPVTISMPFKLLLFVLVDGWGLLIKTLVATYNF